MTLSNNPRLKEDFTFHYSANAEICKAYDSFEKQFLAQILKQYKGNQSSVARVLGWSRTTVRTKLDKHFGNKYFPQIEG